MSTAAIPEVGTVEWKIATFTSAAPPEIAANAAVMDWPDSASGAMTELRAGTNGYTCMPSTTSSMGVMSAEDAAPMCLDQSWVQWATAWQQKKAPGITSLGIGYMLRGDKGASNIDPFATSPTATNEWVVSGPHIMIITPSAASLEALPTDSRSGGPYVMWKGTPYAHIMVPIGAAGAMKM
jgi:hypothetical protein